MPRLEYFVVAETSSIDVNRNSVSIFHVLNDIYFDSLPDSIPTLAVISGWIHSEAEIRDHQESQIRIEFHMPGVDAPKEFRGNLRAESRYQYYNFSLMNVPVKQSGEIEVRLFLDDNQKATHHDSFAF